MFEVGKKYRSKTINVTNVFECIFVGKNIAVFKNSIGGEFVLNNVGFNQYEEYKEPVKHVRYVLWYKRIDYVDCILELNEEGVNKSKDHINRLGYKLLKTEIIECTE